MSGLKVTDEDRVVAAVKQYMELLDAGSAPSHQEFLSQHPDIADQLRPSALRRHRGSPWRLCFPRAVS